MFAITEADLPQKRKYTKKQDKDNRGRPAGKRNLRHNMRHKNNPLSLSKC